MLAHGSDQLLTTMADSEATLWDISIAGSSSSSSPYTGEDNRCRPYSPTHAVGTVQWLNQARTKPRRVCTVLGVPREPRSVHFAPFGSSECPDYYGSPHELVPVISSLMLLRCAYPQPALSVPELGAFALCDGCQPDHGGACRRRAQFRQAHGARKQGSCDSERR